MQISRNWLCDLLEEVPAVEELAELLTHAGLEVEAIDRLGQGLDHVVVGRVLEKRPVEGSDKLHLCSVDVGDGTPLQIVCGAANYEVGARVPTALVGAELPGGMRIERRKLRGVESAGMLCSEVEIGISDESSGLMLLPEDAPVGTPIVDYLHLDDVVLTINATPNRPDWLSHLGVARELAAITGARLRMPEAKVREEGASASERIAIEIEAPDRCTRYAGRVVEGVRFGPSPLWMQQRLRACGVRALGNLIDVTNYVLLETGHPLHAFDLDQVRGGRIVVRRAGAGEKLTTLDDKERTLVEDDLVIADAERALVLAGVMGGADAEVGQGTTRVLLESAHFAPEGVRRASRRHGLHTESSHRFERGADPGAVRAALDRAAALLVELAGGQVRQGVVDVHPRPAAPRSVALRWRRVGELLGVDVPVDRARSILVELGFELDGEDEAGARFRVPSFRVDVEGEADLIEEIARIHGYDQVPTVLPPAGSAPPRDDRATQVMARVREAMAGAGIDEVLNYAFVDPRDLAALDPAGDRPAVVPLKNPLTETQSAMRTTLVAGLLRNASFNLNRQVEDLRFYEIGPVFLPEARRDSPVAEPVRLAGLLQGNRRPAGWAEPAQPVDFYDAKGAIEAALAAIGASDVRWEPGEATWLHPRSAARILLGDREAGLVGELHPQVAEAFDLPRGVFVFELDFGAVVDAARLLPRFGGVPRFPAVLRDLAVVVSTEVSAAQVEGVLRGPIGEGLVESVELFDVYQGPQLGEGRKNLAYAIRYRASDRTLEEKEITRVHGALVAALEREVGAELRG